MTYGDGMITPAISVLSALEGLEVATPVLKPYVLPVTLVVLFGLFFVQKRGTGSVGAAFGPIMIVWFSTLAVLGVSNIIANPSVLWGGESAAHGLRFLIENRGLALVAMGAVVLAVTGAEALYADMGHFGAQPIRQAWFLFVLPSLMLNYFGQGALILTHPEAVENPFYHQAPAWMLYPLVGLATVATVIASQAVISGAFSVSRQAMQLGFLPRFEVQHTSEKEQGQVYLPGVNRTLLCGGDSRPRLPFEFEHRRGVRHCGDRRHGHHLLSGDLRCRQILGLGLAAGDGAVRRVPCRRSYLPLGEHPEDPGRRLVPAGDRFAGLPADEYLEAWGTVAYRAYER